MSEPIAQTTEPGRAGYLRWIAVAVTAIVLLLAAGWIALDLGWIDSPWRAVRELVWAYQSQDADRLRSRIGPDLWAQLGPDVRDVIPRGVSEDFDVDATFTTARATQVMPTGRLTLDLRNELGWRITKITFVRETTELVPYTDERVVSVSQLPEGESIPLSEGVAGRTEFITATTLVNGQKTGERRIKGRTAEKSTPRLVVKGSGKVQRYGSIRIFFDDKTFTVTHNTSPSDSATASAAFRYFMVLPSGQVAEVDGSAGGEASAGSTVPASTDTRTLERTWVVEDLAGGDAAAAVKNGWPKGRYVLGVTADGSPLGWGTYVIP